MRLHDLDPSMLEEALRFLLLQESNNRLKQKKRRRSEFGLIGKRAGLPCQATLMRTSKFGLYVSSLDAKQRASYDSMANVLVVLDLDRSSMYRITMSRRLVKRNNDELVGALVLLDLDKRNTNLIADNRVNTATFGQQHVGQQAQANCRTLVQSNDFCGRLGHRETWLFPQSNTIVMFLQACCNRFASRFRSNIVAALSLLGSSTTGLARMSGNSNIWSATCGMPRRSQLWPGELINLI